MKKVLCFLHKKGVVDIILELALSSGIKEAKCLGVTDGAIAAAIIVNGELYLKSRAFEGNKIKENNPNKLLDKGSKTIINYVGYATNKIMESVHTITPPFVETVPVHSEVNNIGLDYEVYFCKNQYEEESTFILTTAYSGADSINYHQITNTACRSAWQKMKNYKNPDGSSTELRNNIGVII
ncbi:MAG: hypothetical protein WCJ36_01920 [Candidatus Saccharibacteria bacterium]